MIASRIFLAVIGVVYLYLAGWCSLMPEQTSRLVGFDHRLASVGRMALTNYLMQSLLCMTFFNGYGFGFYGAFDRVQLYGIVAGVWSLQLWYSPIWLRYFRFGPVEWLWRSLTYGTIQPMRNQNTMASGMRPNN